METTQAPSQIIIEQLENLGAALAAGKITMADYRMQVTSVVIEFKVALLK
jgi:hypothetical protein